MSLKSLLRPSADTGLVARFEAKVSQAQAELAEASRAARGALLEVKSSDSASWPQSVLKARRHEADAQERLDALTGALQEAREREAAAKAAADAERAQRQRARFIADRDAAIERADKTGATADEKIAELAAAVLGALEAERELQAYFPSDEFAGQYASLLMMLPVSIAFPLRALPSMVNVAGAFLGAERAVWSQHAPSRVLRGREVEQ